MTKPWQALEQYDPEIYSCIELELKRQVEGLELIASENFATTEVITSMANVMCNKYAEGRPNKRYYGGCEHVDKAENIAIERVCKLFDCNYANVQPHSGAQANAAVLLALCEPGSKILGLDLSHGGHLTHGSPVNFSGIYYKAHSYSLNVETETLDYEAILKQALELKPKLIIAGASAYPRAIDFAKFRKIADEVGAYLLADVSHIAGLIVTGLHQNPFPHAHVVTSTTHKTLRGPRGGVILWSDKELTARLNKGVFPGIQGGPLEHIIASKAVAFKKAGEPEFVSYQKQTIENTFVLGNELKSLGFKVVSGGSDNHLLLIDLCKSHPETTGKTAENALELAGITVNKNTVPGEKRSPFVTSGIRVGTPALTSRKMGSKEMKIIASFIKEAIDHSGNESHLLKLKEKVKQLACAFPLYPEWS